jgi:hypothetical protein
MGPVATRYGTEKEGKRHDMGPSQEYFKNTQEGSKNRPPLGEGAVFSLRKKIPSLKHVVAQLLYPGRK